MIATLAKVSKSSIIVRMKRNRLSSPQERQEYLSSAQEMLAIVARNTRLMPPSDIGVPDITHVRHRTVGRYIPGARSLNVAVVRGAVSHPSLRVWLTPARNDQAVGLDIGTSVVKNTCLATTALRSSRPFDHPIQGYEDLYCFGADVEMVTPAALVEGEPAPHYLGLYAGMVAFAHDWTEKQVLRLREAHGYNTSR